MISHALNYTNARNNNMYLKYTQYDHTFVGGRGRGQVEGSREGARGPQQIILPDQPKLGCYGPVTVALA